MTDDKLYMGIDGGGSTLRVGVYTASITRVNDTVVPLSVNPSVVDRALAQERIRTAVREMLDGLPGGASAIEAAGIGVAGADEYHARDWLIETLEAVLPSSHIVPSSDYEIALVGGRGERYGVLLLAGTGCVAYGVNRDGQARRLGGWGY
ncbi:MAG: BadF/BadG/BcrA/BcrD ATPase family protein, partial [Chloroflexota bacterium]